MDAGISTILTKRSRNKGEKSILFATGFERRKKRDVLARTYIHFGQIGFTKFILSSKENIGVDWDISSACQ